MGRETKVSSSRKTFIKGDRLLQRADFVRLGKGGERVKNRHFIAYIRKNNLNGCRLGITVTRKVGNAVQRNRIKRLAREYFRQNRDIFKGYWDINLVATRQSVDCPNNIMFASLENIFARIATYPTN